MKLKVQFKQDLVKVNDSEVSLDERKQKHVSFDSSSILRSQTVANMTETEAQRTAATTSPSKSSERLLDGRKTPDYILYSELFTPEVARQIVLGGRKTVCLLSEFYFSLLRSVEEIQYADPGHPD